MRLTETAGLLASSISAAYVAIRSPLVAATVTVAVGLLMITESRYASLCNEHCMCAVLGEEKGQA